MLITFTGRTLRGRGPISIVFMAASQSIDVFIGQNLRCGPPSVIRVVLALAFIMAASASGQVPDLLGSLVDYLPGDESELLRMAPIVVLAAVERNEIAGSGRPSVGMPEITVQPHRVTCRLEEVLRIDAERTMPDVFTFIYYSTGEVGAYNPFHKSRFEAAPGRRYFFPLIRVGGDLRSIGDVGGKYRLLVTSGRHSPSDASGFRSNSDRLESSFGKRIAKILLTPGEDYDASDYAGSLIYYRGFAERLGGRVQTFELLRRMLSAPSTISTTVCFELNRAYHGQFPCLQKIAGDEALSPALRERATARLAEVSHSEALLLADLRNHPARLFTSDSRVWNYEGLTILLIHPRPEVRRSACVAIKRYFPERPQATSCRPK
jgi:hypothetical protein